MDMFENEVIVSQATYKGVRIFATSFNCCIVEYGSSYYRRGSLAEAKELIDELRKSRRN